jgi:hypothetical protein
MPSMDVDPWASRQVKPRPVELFWGPWMQVQTPEGRTLVARILETPLGELVIHWDPEGLELFSRQGAFQARMAKAGIIPPVSGGPGHDGQGPPA